MAIDVKLAAPARRALAAAGINELEDLAKFTEKQVKELHGMGPNALKKLKEAMAALRITFAP